MHEHALTMQDVEDKTHEELTFRYLAAISRRYAKRLILQGSHS